MSERSERIDKHLMRTSASRRINRIDRPWVGHWHVMGACPITPPKAADLRSAYVQFLQDNPDHALAARIADDSLSWVPIAPNDRVEYAERVIRECDDPMPEPRPEVLVDFVGEVDPHDALNVLVGPDWIAVQTSHLAVDGLGLDFALHAVATGDFSRLASFGRRASVPVLLGAAARCLPRFGRQWAGIAVNRERTPSGDDAPAVAGSSWAGRPPRLCALQGAVSTGEFSAVNAWRKQVMPGVTLNSLITSAVWRALRAEGVPVTSAGFNGLFDLRRFLPEKDRMMGGNLAKSIFIAADMTDPVSVQRTVSRTMESGRALPATLLGAAMYHHPHTPTSADGPLVLTYSSMPNLPRDQMLPYTDAGPHRVVGFGYPIAPTGITVFTARMQNSTDVLASFDARTVDPASVQRALDRLADIRSLMA